MRTLIVLLAAALAISWALPGSPAARASGSVDVTVIDTGHTLKASQTFRKILPAGAGKTYYPAVRKRFLKVLGGLNPALATFVSGTAQPKVGALAKSVSLTAPTARCRKADCVLDTVRFPAIVLFSDMMQKTNSRTAYTIGLPFATLPSAAHIRWLRRGLQKVIDAHGGQSDHAPLVVAQIPQTVRSGAGFEVRIRTSASVTAAAAAGFGQQIAGLHKRLGEKVVGLVKRSKRVALGTFDAALPSYDRKKGTLPARLLVHAWRPLVYVQIEVGLKKLDGKATFGDFKRKLWELADHG